MKRCVLLIVLLFHIFPVLAQNEQEAEKYYGLAVEAFNNKNLTKSLKIFRKCDSLRTKEPEYVGITANTNHWLGYVLSQLGRTEEAQKECLYYYLIQPEDFRKYVEILALEAQAQSSKKAEDYNTAFSKQKACLARYITDLGVDHYFVGNVYNEMANLAKNVEEEKNNVLKYYDKSIECFANMGKKGKAVCQFLNLDKCFYLQTIEKFSEAAGLMPQKEELLPQHKAYWYMLKCFHENSTGNSEQLNNLVSDYENDTDCNNDTVFYQTIKLLDVCSYDSRGMHNECIESCYKLMNSFEKKNDTSSIDYLDICLVAGNHLRETGRLLEEALLYIKTFQSADSTLRRSLNLSIAEPNVSHPMLRVMSQILIKLVTIADVIGMRKGFTGYGVYAKRILDQADWTNRQNTPDFPYLVNIYASAVNELADVETNKGNIKAGIEYYENALKIPAIKESTWGPSLMQNCGVLYYIDKKYQKAIECFEKSYNQNNQGKGAAESNLLVAYAHVDPESQRVAELDSISFARHKQSVMSKFLSTTDSDREYLWNNDYRRSNEGFAVYAAMCKGKNAAVNRIAYDALLLGRGFLLCTLADKQKAFSESTDSSLLQIKERINEIMVIQDKYKDNTPEKLELLSEKTRLESAIAQKLLHDTQLMESYTTSTTDIQQCIGEHSIAVEFVYTLDSATTANRSYYAFLLRKNWNAPRLVKLDVPRDFFTYKDLYTNAKWTSLMWDKICRVGNISKGDTIFFAADRDIHGTNIENMRLKNGKVISEKYHIIRLSSTRGLCNRRISDVSFTDAVLYGGLDYAAVNNTPDISSSGNRAADAGLPALPYTKEEVNKIEHLLKESFQQGVVTCYTEHMGTENTFRELSGHSPGILHIATHGAYLDEGKSEMDRSVLYLSDSESAYYGESTVVAECDGILSAAELCEMDLTETDLVVMSACNSARGTIGYDGVFGLQRGFKIAGVKSILMTLWEVDDEATCKLMTEFYSNWIGKKMIKHDALEAAKKTVRETKGWEDPKYWAAFILLDGLD